MGHNNVMRRFCARLFVTAMSMTTAIACHGTRGTTTPHAVTDSSPVTPARDLAAAKQAAKQIEGDKLAVADPRVVNLDIIRINATRGPGGDIETTSVATADLFREAGEAVTAGRVEDAMARYRQIVAEFPASLYAPVSLFNVAALQDKLGDRTATIATLRDLIRQYPQSHESIEGHLYIAALQAEKDQWADALATLDGLLARPNLTYADRVEAFARRGYVQLEMSRDSEAATSLASAIDEWRKAPRIDDTYYIAMAAYYQGELAHQKFLAAPIRLPDATLYADLQHKRDLAVVAYDHWKDSLHYNDPYWGTAAGYQMSQIFVELWEATVKAPFPTQLSSTARDKYIEEVHARMREHLTKALDGHRMNLELAKTYGVETSWSRGSAIRVPQVFEMLQRDSTGSFVRPGSTISPPSSGPHASN